MPKVKMTRPIGGFAQGDERELSQADAQRLVDRGAAEFVGKARGAAERNKSKGAAQSNKSAAK
jgi:hypothetical protein